MIFWDSSALVALLVSEKGTAQCIELLKQDHVMTVWWGTSVECESAIQRRIREGVLSRDSADLARKRLETLAASWHEVSPTDGLRKLARRLLRTHPLRAADSLQLAAALVVSQSGVVDLQLASADERLNQAAEIEGLRIAVTRVRD